ncbi:MAG: FAD-dependent oxidoreductase [Verrucomicrobiota bacterium]
MNTPSPQTSLPSHVDVLIIGGGIIGAATAYELSQRGKSVVLVDKGEIGHGCSYGNAGWIVPCGAHPLPMPGMILKSIGWLLDPTSPLYIKPRLSPSLASWLIRFLLSTNQRLMKQSVTALTELATYSLESFKKMEADYPGSLSFHQKGYLRLAGTEEGLRAALHDRNLATEQGIRSQGLTAEEVHALEPHLKKGAFVGGVYYPDEAHVEPLAAVKTLIQAAQERGTIILPHTEVFDFVKQGNRIEKVRTTRGDITATEVILATGTWSEKMSRRLGSRIPILGGKGYAITVKKISPSPQIPIMFIDRKIAITPRDESIRLAGTMEIVDDDESITTHRVETILRGARELLHLPEKPEIIEVWRGLRPCTPDGVPVIGRSPRYHNLIIAAGHQGVGLLTAPGTGRLVADLVCHEKPLFNPYPFRANRF